MSTMNQKTELCLRVEESLADVLDGSAAPALFEHIADCDDCRDLRHDAERAAVVVRNASADFRTPSGFAESLVAKIDAARPAGPAGAPSVAQVGSVKSDGVSMRGASVSGEVVSEAPVE